MQEETNLVAMWLKKDKTRWFAGASAGAFAGLVMLAVAVILGLVGGKELWFPIKLAAVPFLGASAMEHGANSSVLILGFILHEALCVFLGVIYAHFTGTNSLPALVGVGLAWGAFGWIFINRLYSPSFRDIFVADVPGGISFFVWISFGLALTSVSFFDRTLRGRAAS